MAEGAHVGVVILLGLAACDGAPTRLHPGPCSASQGSRMSCGYTYDDAGRPLEATCDYRATATEYETGTVTARWTFDGDALVGYAVDRDFADTGVRDEAWTIGATEVTRTWNRNDGLYSRQRDEVYDAAGFALIGELYDLETGPSADDRLTSAHLVNRDAKTEGEEVFDYTYTYAPATIPADGQRVQTRTEDGETETFDYQGGRLLTDERYTYAWSGDRLIALDGRTDGNEDVAYAYDAFGNLLERRGDWGGLVTVTTFDYGCWE